MRSDTKTIRFGGRDWLWPVDDSKLLQVNDWVNDLQVVRNLMSEANREFDTAVQAGGACGIWPWELAKHFADVYTFEPEPLNFYCLIHNVPAGVHARQAALGAETGRIEMKLPDSEAGNVGAYYTMPTESGIPQVALDDTGIIGVDLLCLDVEGREIEVLQGAGMMIERDLPWIMMEEKPLPQMGGDVPHKAGDAMRYLIDHHNYEVVANVHRDVILRAC